MKLYKSITKIFSAAVILGVTFVISCADVPRDNAADQGGDSYNSINADKTITSFSFVDPAASSSVISEADSTIIVYLPEDAVPESLDFAAVFVTSAETVSVNGRNQINGVTVNDFTEPVIYTVTARDGSSREYTVSVQPISDKSFTSFRFLDPAVNGVINETESKITVYVTYDTDITSLVAEFTTTAKYVDVYGREQASGLTENDFSEPVYYTLTALDGTTRIYTVSVEFVVISGFSVTDPDWNEDVSGTIDHNLKTITVELPYYMNLAYLVPSFNASDNVTQVSGNTNDFKSSSNIPFVYRITDENGVSQEYSVTVRYRNSVTHYAGSTGGCGIKDGIGSAASLGLGGHITSDFNNIYVADAGNHIIRKIEINTGNVTTLAGSRGQYGFADGTGTSAKFYTPYGITSDGTNLYVADRNNNRIRKIVISSGVVSTIAGTGESSVFADDADGYNNGITSTFYGPCGITTDGVNLYITDTYNHRIRKIVIASGAVSTIAGTGDTVFADDGDGYTSGIASTFNQPFGITTDGINLYVTDKSNKRMRQIVISSGVVSTIAGTGVVGSSDDPDGTTVTSSNPASNGIIDSRFMSPVGVTTDGTNLYVSDGAADTIRQIVISSGVVSTIAGKVTIEGSTDGFVQEALFNTPSGITYNNSNLFIFDSGGTIRVFSLLTKWVGTLVGSAYQTGLIDGAAADARFNMPGGITTDGTNFYIADVENNKIRKININNGNVSTIVSTSLSAPSDVTTDGINLYVASRGNHKIFKIEISSGTVSVFAGTGGTGSVDDGDGLANGISSTFEFPYGITTDGINLYVTDANYGSYAKIRKIVISSGVVSTIAGTGVQGSLDDPDGFENGISSTFKFPQGITTDGTNLYVADAGNVKIRKIVISSGIVSTIAGKGIDGSADDPDGITVTSSNPVSNGIIDSTFKVPRGITTDGINLYIGDSSNNIIRKISISTGVVTTIAGMPGVAGNTNGAGINLFYSPVGIKCFNKKLYICDELNNAIRVINP